MTYAKGKMRCGEETYNIICFLSDCRFLSLFVSLKGAYHIIGGRKFSVYRTACMCSDGSFDRSVQVPSINWMIGLE